MRPNDITDLSIAPVLLALDSRLEELADLSRAKLPEYVALAADSADTTQELRSSGLIRAITHLIELHGWDVDWDVRGLRVSHGHHHVVLGVPSVLRDYVELGG